MADAARSRQEHVYAGVSATKLLTQLIKITVTGWQLSGWRCDWRQSHRTWQKDWVSRVVRRTARNGQKSGHGWRHENIAVVIMGRTMSSRVVVVLCGGRPSRHVPYTNYSHWASSTWSRKSDGGGGGVEREAEKGDKRPGGKKTSDLEKKKKKKRTMRVIIPRTTRMEEEQVLEREPRTLRRWRIQSKDLELWQQPRWANLDVVTARRYTHHSWSALQPPHNTGFAATCVPTYSVFYLPKLLTSQAIKELLYQHGPRQSATGHTLLYINPESF